MTPSGNQIICGPTQGVDFFPRSGAVEQLRVHVRNLGMLGISDSQGKSYVELFERGYGKDAAGIAKEAIGYGKLEVLNVND